MTERWQAFADRTSVFFRDAWSDLSATLDRVSSQLAQAFGSVPMEQAIWAATVAGASLLVTTLLILFVRRRGAGRTGKRSARALALAARGLDDVEISRQTGLSRDAVSMLNLARTARSGRRNLPLAARIADEESNDTPAPQGGRNPQAYHTQRVADKTRPRRFAAHRLLDRLSQSLRIPRFHRAA